MFDSTDVMNNRLEMSLLQIVKQLVLKKDYSALQSLFLEHLTKDVLLQYLPEYWECISYLTKPTINLTAQAKELAELVFEHLFEFSYNNEALDHIRRFSNLMNPDRNTRQQITALYNRVYSANKNLNILIRISEVRESAPLFQSIETLDKLINLDIGSPIYSTRFGYGEITKIDFLLDTLTINFFNSQLQTITLQQAVTSLQPIPKDNIFYLKDKKSPVLSQLVKENPVELERLIKRDLPENHKTNDIKHILKCVVSDEDINAFIEHIKKGKPKTKKQTINQAPAINYATLTSLTSDAIVTLLNNTKSITRQKILQEIKSRRSDWQELFTNIFFTQLDKRVFQTILSELDQEKQKQIIDKILIEYKRVPFHFLWLSEADTIKDVLTNDILNKYLDLSVQYPSEIRKKLIADDYAFINKTVETKKPENAKQLLERIKEIRTLYPEEKDKIETIFKQKFPEIFETKDDLIYHTESSIKNKELELRKIVTEDIPQVANEIGQARSYGDLSENFEYKAALQKQKRLMHKVSIIREELTFARPIDFSKVESDKVSLGTTVKLQLLSTDSTLITYAILGPWDSDPHQGIISYLAPFAKKLLNKKVDDEITDDEGKTFKVVEITKATS